VWLRSLLGLIEGEMSRQVDFDFVTGRIATGSGLNSADDVNMLVSSGINVVIDCRNDFDDGPLFAGNPNINYLWNPTADDGTTKPPEYWQRSLEFALPLLAKPHTKVYAHCAAGINRGPSTAYCLMVALGFDPDLAEKLIRDARPVVRLAYMNDAVTGCRSLGYI
jgi:protein-tyrosine phosphatase